MDVTTLLLLGLLLLPLISQYLIMRGSMKHELWKKGVYCKKCGKEIKTNSYLKLILWSDYHSIVCFKLNVDFTSFLLLPKLKEEEYL